MTERGSAGRFLARLKDMYPDAQCSLDFENPYQLLVATVLSAQCTDERVNKVTPALFKRCPGPAEMAAMTTEDVEALIRSTGFFRNKARSLLGASKMLVEEFGGRVPAKMEDLVRLPGVARKTANVVLGNAFGLNEGVVVDTHVRRLAKRMGLSESDNPDRVEQDLVETFPKKSWTFLAHALIQHGRRVCTARKPRCNECGLKAICPRVGV